MKSPYKVIKTEHFGDLLTPYFWLPVQVKTKVVPLLFLLDTGADVTSLPVSAAKSLDVDLTTCPKESMEGYEGTAVTVYRSTILIFLNNRRYKIPCVFTPIEHVPILLGRAGILEKFTITLDGKKKEVRFKEV
jgi:hypothetical protein